MSRTRDELIFLRSQDATYDSNYDFSFQLKHGLHNVKSLQLITYNIPYAFPNVDAYGNSLVFTEEGNTKTITIAVGTYDISALIVALKAAMDAASTSGNTFTISFSDITNTLTFTSSTTEFTIVKTGTTLIDTIGLSNNITSSTRSLTLPRSVDLLTVKELQIHLRGLIRNYESNNDDQSSDMLMLVPLAGNDPYSYITNSYTGVELDSLDTNIYMITMSIVDQKGFSPDWDVHQYPFSILLKATVFV